MLIMSILISRRIMNIFFRGGTQLKIFLIFIRARKNEAFGFNITSCRESYICLLDFLLFFLECMHGLGVGVGVGVLGWSEEGQYTVGFLSPFASV